MAPKKILLAEDDVDDRIFFYDYLHQRKDISLLPSVENGVELFEFLDAIADDSNLPQLIILDQNMPKRNGIQSLQILKSNKRYSQIPVMIYSTYTDARLVDNCTAMGALLVTSKPLTPEGYNKMIDTFLQAAF